MHIRFEIEGSNVAFKCKTVDSYTGFAHVVEMVVWGKDIYERRSTRVNYYNRTWEAWIYQTACKNVVAKRLNAIESDLKSELKIQNGWARMTPKRDEVLKKVIAEDSLHQFYLKLYRELEKR